MNGRGIGRVAGLAILVGAVIPSAGCAYWTNRVNDLKDCWELGVTESPAAQFGLYGGVTHGFMLGTTSLRCKLHGLANSQWGTHQVVDDSWGWGVIGEDTHQVASGDGVLPVSNLPKYDTGLLGLAFGRTAGLKRGLDSPFIIHFGWSGVMINTRGSEVLDSCLGWFGLDIMKDDTGQRPLGREFD